MIDEILKKFEKQLYLWIKDRRYKIVTFLVLMSLIIVLSMAPYLNLFIESELVIYFILVLAILVFNISLNKIILVSLLLFFISMVFFLLRDLDTAELIVNYIYGIFLVGIILKILDYKNDDKKTHGI